MCLLYHILLNILTLYLCCQIQLSDTRLLTGLYNYRIKLPQIITYTSILLAASIIIAENHFIGIDLKTLYACTFTIPFCFICEWLLARFNPANSYTSILFRIALTCLISILAYLLFSTTSLIPAIIYGLYVRNNPLGCPHINSFIIANKMRRGKSPYLYSNKERKDNTLLNENLPTFNVTKYGIHPNSDQDQLDATQKLIDTVGG